MASAVGLSRGLDDRLVVEVGIGRAGGTDVVRLVGVPHVPAVFVRLAVDGDGPDS